MTKAIPGIRYGLSLYWVSEKAGLSTVVSLEGPIHFPPVKHADPSKPLASFGCGHVLAPLGEIDDWRLMSDAEVRDYKEGDDD
ncbi:hypothetical protein [Rhodoblastus sp.]|uniref:hypothetical protein n=1 Tax=Rhodoblastus sp. TaxID=1962975 RepID=UPI003F9EBA75